MPCGQWPQPQEVLPHLHAKAHSQDYWRIPVQLGLEELHFNRRRQGDLVLLAQGLLTSPEATPRTHLWSGYVADLVGVPRIAADLAKLGMQDRELPRPPCNRRCAIVQATSRKGGIGSP